MNTKRDVLPSPTLECLVSHAESLGFIGEQDWIAAFRRAADVRTLDDWAADGMRIGVPSRKAVPVPYLDAGSLRWRIAPEENGAYIDTDHAWFADCATPDEARAKAAAWVREQKAGT